MNLCVDTEAEPQVVFLLHPASGMFRLDTSRLWIGEKEKYLHVEQHFLEIVKTEEKPSSWFVNNQVIQGTYIFIS